MDVESVAIAALAFDPANARKHQAKNLDAIKGSLARFGQQKPIVIGKNNVVIAGNGTLEAARSLGWTKINVVRTELEGTEATAFAIADNRTGELAEWDAGILSETLKSLQAMDFDLGAIGFDADDLSAMIAGEEPAEGLTDPDEVPEDVETRCKPGDLWALGKHRLLCGDSTNVLDVERLMGGEKADMVFTDPPYGVSAVSGAGRIGASNLAKTGVYSQIIGDETTDTARATYNLVAGLDVPVVVLWGGNYYSEFCPPSACWIVWDKRGDMASNNFADCELAWTNLSKPARVYKQVWSGMIKEGESGKRVHPTQKPIALAEWCFGELDPKGKTVLDLFLGSGSTLIACEKTARRCFGMEIDPKYCDVVLARWEKFTGQTAALQSLTEAMHG